MLKKNQFLIARAIIHLFVALVGLHEHQFLLPLSIYQIKAGLFSR